VKLSNAFKVHFSAVTTQIIITIGPQSMWWFKRRLPNAATSVIWRKQGYLLATSRQMQHHYRLVAVDTAVNSEEERVQEGKERKGKEREKQKIWILQSGMENV
jgi:hypothetical protein